MWFVEPRVGVRFRREVEFYVPPLTLQHNATRRAAIWGLRQASGGDGGRKSIIRGIRSWDPLGSQLGAGVWVGP